MLSLCLLALLGLFVAVVKCVSDTFFGIDNCFEVLYVFVYNSDSLLLGLVVSKC